MAEPQNILLTWDIDGTLLLGNPSRGFHGHAFATACTELFGPCDLPEKFLGESTEGWTDKSILAALIRKIGREPTEDDLLRGQLRVEEIYLERCDEKPRVLPGVAETLALLSSYPSITMALASGNYPRIGWRKLELAELDQYFPERIAGLGTIFERRDALLVARRKAEEVKGVKFDLIMHIGDTLADITAAMQTGAIPFCVKTGRIVLAQTEYPKESYVVDNLVDGRELLWTLLHLSEQ
jgi:phosphoglycolate phosphatase-like HAD superfamily hydrolase